MSHTMAPLEPSSTPRDAEATNWTCGVRILRDGDAWVHVAGRLDLDTAPTLEQTLGDAESVARLIVLDLRELTSIDPAGLGVIVFASRRARSVRRRLILVRGPAHVDRVFVESGAWEILEIGDLDPVRPRASVPFQHSQDGAVS